MNRYTLLLALAVSTVAAGAEPAKTSGRLDTIYMNETVISGNQELPKVLYILPWRDDPGKALNAQAPDFGDGGVIKPIYPDEYRRMLEYRSIARQFKAQQ